MMVICDLNKDIAKAVVNYASYPNHWYRPADGTCEPSNNPAQSLVMDASTHIVFCWAVHPADGHVYRQIMLRSLTTTRPGIPAPHIGLTLATWYGFTGGHGGDDETRNPGPDWIIYDNGAAKAADKVLLIAQPVSQQELAAAVAMPGPPPSCRELYPRMFET
jgi:hypothetical protein